MAGWSTRFATGADKLKLNSPFARITEIANSIREKDEWVGRALLSLPGRLNASLAYMETVDAEIVIIGSGPAGLKAALAAAKQGGSVLILDENHLVGGQLIKQTHKFFGSLEEKAGTRGIKIAQDLLETINDNKSKVGQESLPHHRLLQM